MPPERSKQKARSRSICTNRDEERWQIPYSEYARVAAAAKRYVKHARIFITADELMGYITDVCIKIEATPAYRSKLSRLDPDHRLSYILRCIKARINDEYRAQAIHTRYGEQTRPILNNSALSPDDTPFEIDPSLVLREILAL
jgi:hypothetical protein